MNALTIRQRLSKLVFRVIPRDDLVSAHRRAQSGIGTLHNGRQKALFALFEVARRLRLLNLFYSTYLVGRPKSGPTELTRETNEVSQETLGRIYKPASKKCVVLISHDSSLTGAPVLVWNIAAALRRANLFVVLISMRPGPLSPQFNEAADVFYELHRDSDGERREIARRVAAQFEPLFVIANSAVSAPLAVEFAHQRIPVVALIHEFGTFAFSTPRLRELLESASALVFPAPVVKNSMVTPDLSLDGAHILPQGRSAIPPNFIAKEAVPEFTTRHQVRSDAEFVVLGVGTIEWRKGVDFFVATATAVANAAPDMAIRFVWLGNSPPSHYAEFASYLDEQIARSRLGSRLAMLPATRQIEEVYAASDCLFLSSRLDPLPNVSIDAAVLGIPVVCFEGASGYAELIKDFAWARSLVAPYLDIRTASDHILNLARNAGLAKSLSEAQQSWARNQFDMESYVARLIEIGTAAAEENPKTNKAMGL